MPMPMLPVLRLPCKLNKSSNTNCKVRYAPLYIQVIIRILVGVVLLLRIPHVQDMPQPASPRRVPATAAAPGGILRVLPPGVAASGARQIVSEVPGLVLDALALVLVGQPHQLLGGLLLWGGRQEYDCEGRSRGRGGGGRARQGARSQRSDKRQGEGLPAR